jgi:nucleotide-binding universal stress UspA family protein
VHVELFEGVAREALLERAEGADLLVVGSRSHGLVRGMLLGSVALHCIVHAPCTVLVVHPQDRPAPAERAVQPAAARG